MQQQVYGNAAFVQPPFESRQIIPFCTLPPDALPGLNASLTTQMPPALFSALQAEFRDREHREPTVGEVRLLSRLYELTLSDVSRIGVSELFTDSHTVAESWADLMARHRLLAADKSSPCALPDIISATDDYLRRTGERPLLPPVRVLTENPACPSITAAYAIADGYLPVTRLLAEDTARLVCIARPEEARSRKQAAPMNGDILLLLRSLPAEKAAKLIHPFRNPTTGERKTNAVVLHAGCPLPLAVTLLCERGAEIRAEILCPEGGDTVIPTVSLIGVEEGIFTNPTYLLRLHRTELNGFLAECRRQNTPVPPIVIGQAVGNERVTFLQGTSVLASLSISTLHIAVRPWLYPVRPTAGQTRDGMTAPCGITRPAIAILPAADMEHTSESPLGCEISAVPVVPAPVRLPCGVILAAADITLTADKQADGTPTSYLEAGEAVRAALNALTDVGIAPAAVSLSVSVSGIHVEQDGSGLPYSTFGALCGLYRACADLRLPAPDPGLIPAHTPDEPCHLSVVAWVYQPTAPAALRGTVLMPCLHPSNEDSLRTLSAVLERQGLLCLIQPVNVEPVPLGELQPEGDAVTAVSYRPDVTSVATLCRGIRHTERLVLAMSAEDGKILLSDPTIWATLKEIAEKASDDMSSTSPRILAIGGVCVPLAQAGVLPTCLAGELTRIPTAGKCVRLTPAKESGTPQMRLCRFNLLTPDPNNEQGDARWMHHTATGNVPDGYIGCEGAVIGYLNGYIED